MATGAALFADADLTVIALVVARQRLTLLICCRCFCLIHNRTIMTTMAENVEKATRPQLQDLVRILVERVRAQDRTIDSHSIEWTPPARSFFGEGALLWRPRTGAGR